MTQQRTLLAALLGIAIAAPGLQGCMRGCDSSRPPILINTSMFNQPKALPYASSAFFFDGKTMRDPVPGTIARGQLPAEAAAAPLGEEARAAQLARGRDRFTIYCVPCHDERGEGRGILAERAKVPTANLHDQKVRVQTDDMLFDTITNGKGLMPSYHYPIGPDDRRAIIAYVRHLQEADDQLEAQK